MCTAAPTSPPPLPISITSSTFSGLFYVHLTCLSSYRLRVVHFVWVVVVVVLLFSLCWWYDTVCEWFTMPRLPALGPLFSCVSSPFVAFHSNCSLSTVFTHWFKAFWFVSQQNNQQNQRKRDKDQCTAVQSFVSSILATSRKAPLP